MANFPDQTRLWPNRRVSPHNPTANYYVGETKAVQNDREMNQTVTVEFERESAIVF
jgi:hypothetical protein